MARLGSIVLVAIALTAIACKRDEPAVTAPPAPKDPATAPAPPAPPSVSQSDPAPAPGGAIRLGDVGFQTPESVLYDEAADVYLVSNIHGDPSGADDNGFISRVSPDGKVIDLKWIDGAKDDVSLDAPKGMAISGGILWVADRTRLRKFDAKTGEPKGEVALPGSTFVNDVAAATDGVYATDSGLTPEFKPSGTDAVVHVSADGKVHVLAKAKDLGGPNGVHVAADGSIWVVTFGSGEIYKVAEGKKVEAFKAPKGQLDGILGLEGGELLVSSWEASAVFRGKPGGAWSEAVSGVKAPADIGWDSKRKRLLIPLFMDNAIEIRELK